MKPAIKALSWLYGSAAEVKNTLYDRKLLRPESCGRRVISVGNLTVGGTGKTPVVDFCLQRLLFQGRRPGIVCRSYRARRTEPGRVSGSSPELDGDEASWYARRHPGVPVWSGPVKRQTARDLADNEDVDVILVDDGFQHRGLKRDLDLLLLDACDPFSAYQPLPAGRAREPFEAFKRAGAILLTKTNLAEPEHLQVLKTRLREAPHIPVFEFESRLDEIEIPEGPILAVSGIARPESFLELLRRRFPGRTIQALPFGDHHAYTDEDVRKILAVARSMGGEGGSAKSAVVVTTEKDDVKLRALWPADQTLHSLPLRITLKGSIEAFDELIRRVF